jgi:hypothetical protein
MTLTTDVLAHHLRLFGLALQTTSGEESGLILRDAPDADEAMRLRSAIAAGAVLVAHRAVEGFCAAFGVERREGSLVPPSILVFAPNPKVDWSRLRTLHTFEVYAHPGAVSLVETATRQAAWAWLPVERGGVLFIGTDLAGDLIRYRQGDPSLVGAAAANETRWGVAGERPNYLFEPQRAGEDPWMPHADHWSRALADSVAAAARIPPTPILPGGAPGAVVITGDDDQAWLEKYEAQLALLREVPITYFLHPLTRHTTKTLDLMRRRGHLDFGIHPDALDAPKCYGKKLSEQSRWYRGLVGERARSLRNHGFLNDGYWGHLPHWRREGLAISSNLPGFDGTALNGSLLPARVALDGALTEHWSILTTIGDGLVFAGGMGGKEAGDCVRRCAERIRQRGIPGVMVLNLHPQNVTEAHEMHLAALETIDSDFVAWNLRQCLEWFQYRDADGGSSTSRGGLRGAVAAGWDRLSRALGSQLVAAAL